MSYKHPSLPRLAPLAAAAALLCAASASMGQVVVDQTNTGTPVGAVNANATSSTFATTSTVATNNTFSATGIGNTAPTASLVINTQPLATPTVTVDQIATVAVSGTTTAKIGIDTTATAAGNGGARTNAQGVANDNSTLSSATGNTDEASLSIQASSPLTIGTPASVKSTQTAVGTVQANTALPDLLGIKLLPRSGNWDNVDLTVDGNQIGAAATANQSKTGATIDAAGALTISAPVRSAVTQIQQGVVGANSQAGLVGIGIENTLLTSLVQPTGSAFTVTGNGMDTSAQGNQLANSVQIDASNLTQTGGAPNSTQVISDQSSIAGVGAASHVDFLGVRNQKPNILLSTTQNQYTVSGNAVGAEAGGNTGSSSAIVGSAGSPVSTINGAIAGVTSTQSHNSATGITAQATAGQIGVAVGGLVGVSIGDQQVVNDNAVNASALGSKAGNQAMLYGATVDQSTAGVNNSQTHVAGPVQSSASATTLGVTIATSSTNGHQTINDNSVQASAQGTLTTNQAAVDAGNSATGVAAGVVNSQLHVDGNVTAGANAGSLGRGVPVSVGDQVTVNNNTVSASALSMQASNAASIKGATVDSSVAAVVNGQTHTAGNVGATAGVSNLGTTSSISSINGHQTVNDNLVKADAQGLTAANQAVVSASNAATGVTAGIASVQTHTAGDVGALTTVGGVLGRSALTSINEEASINRNAVDASALGSKASNLASIEGATVANGVAGASNAQTHTNGNVNAIANVRMLGTISGVASTTNHLTINGNSVQTSAQGATATNRASVQADGSMTDPIAGAANDQKHIAGDINALTVVGQVGSQTLLSTNDQLVVNGNKLTASAGSQSASNLATLDGSSLTASSVGAGAAVNNSQIHSGGNVQAYVGSTQGWSPAPITPVPAMVGGANGATVDGSALVSGNSSAADANINLASNGVTIQSGGSIGGVSSTGIANNQRVDLGNASAQVKVNYGITGARSLGNQAIVLGNTSQASASQNQAVNGITVKAGNALSSVAPVLASTQNSAGNTSATVETSLLTGVGVANLSNGDTTVSNNSASSSARANVANNSISISSGTQTASLSGSLDNKQTNLGSASAGTNLQIPVGSLLANQALGGAVAVTGNSASSLGVGNAALNSIEASAGSALNGGSQFALANTQNNFGPINASTTLNVPVVSSGSSVNLLNNTATASAFGNSAVNQVSLTAMPSQLVASATLTSTQLNTGAVTAVVNGDFTQTSGGGSTGSINISGNRGIAVAVGNSSTSSMVIGVK